MIRAVEKVCERCPVAFVLGTYWNGHYTYERIAYDQAYWSKSPGSILLYRVLEELISTDTPRVFDFGSGEAEYKALFANQQFCSGQIILTRRTFRPTIHLHLEALSKRFVRGARAVARRIGIYSYLRRRVRRR
jgi:CelD/BcsL family acetyltransferase involved in cellulose biosynthesis